MIDALNKEMIQQMLHIAHAESPAVRPEEFAHRTAFLLRIEVSPGSTHFAERIVEEFAVPLCHQISLLTGRSKIILASDHVDPGHILPFHSPEPVCGTESEAAVDAVVLDNMSDILHAVFPAPFSDRTGEVLRIQSGNTVHVVIPDLRLDLPLRALRKEERKERAVFFPVSGSQHFPKFLAPGKRHFLFPQLRIKALLANISELRLIGEKPGDRPAELCRIFRIVSFVDAFDLGVGGHLIDHIDIVRITAAGPRAVDHMHAPLPFGKRKSCFSILTQICQIYSILMEYVSLLIAKGYCSDKCISCLLLIIDRISDLPETDRRFEHPLNIQRQRPARPENIRCRARNILLFPLGVLLDQTICVTGREMLVIEDPDPHISLFCFVQNDIHIVPPARAAEIFVRSCLHAHGADPAFGDPRDLLADDFFRLPAHPEKWEYIVVVHDSPPLSFYLRKRAEGLSALSASGFRFESR